MDYSLQTEPLFVGTREEILLSTAIRTVNIGKEFDENLLHRLEVILKNMGGIQISEESSVVGSQDLWCKKIKINDQILEIESETYVGISITGPEQLVESVAEALRGSLIGSL